VLITAINLDLLISSSHPVIREVVNNSDNSDLGSRSQRSSLESISSNCYNLQELLSQYYKQDNWYVLSISTHKAALTFFPGKPTIKDSIRSGKCYIKYGLI